MPLATIDSAKDLEQTFLPLLLAVITFHDGAVLHEGDPFDASTQPDSTVTPDGATLQDATTTAPDGATPADAAVPTDGIVPGAEPSTPPSCHCRAGAPSRTRPGPLLGATALLLAVALARRRKN